MKPGIFKISIILVLISVIAPLTVSQTKKGKKKEICITFDELPAASGFQEVDREAVTYLILETLKRHKVKAAGFVVGERIEGSFDILGEWLNRGHTLGNMTYTNQDYHQIGIDQFLSDIKSGHKGMETMLSGFGQKRRYFRYPYLHYGNTVSKKEEVTLYLDNLKYRIAHATVVIEDYLYNLSLEKMGKIPDSAKYDKLMNEYINHVLDEIEFTETLSKELLGRSCRHILKLRANRLNAVFLDEMLTQIAQMGYKFVSLDYALKDKLYREPEAYFGARGVGYLQMIKDSDPDHLPAK